MGVEGRLGIHAIVCEGRDYVGSANDVGRGNETVSRWAAHVDKRKPGEAKMREPILVTVREVPLVPSHPEHLDVLPPIASYSLFTLIVDRHREDVE